MNKYNMMRYKYVLIIILLLSGMNTVCYADKGFAKFFKGKKIVHTEGILPVDRVGNKVYVEFPLHLLNKDMLLVTSIEDISDNGEGVVGQFTGNGLHLQFFIQDSVLQARMFTRQMFRKNNLSVDHSDMLDRSTIGGIFKSFKIEVTASDRSAVLVDMTNLFLEHSYYTNPFSNYAGNSMYGFVTRSYRYKEKRSFIRNVSGYPGNLTVTCEQGYDVDHTAFGNYVMYKDVPVCVVVNKILQLLPEHPMTPRMADPRVGVNQVEQLDYSEGNSGVKRVYIAKRWRIEPSDMKMYAIGELVEPKKPIVFYLDTLMPQFWKHYVKEGAEAWNKSFEKIGLKDVIRVMDFPTRDSSFSSTDINYSTIRYAPMWMPFIQTSMYTDPRSGEILNASIYIHSNIVNLLFGSRVFATMAADPAVRCTLLSDEIIGELLKVHITQAVGKCLGLTENPVASYAYPVDSLRSPAFTHQYGLSPSVMDKLICNYIAQQGDAERGVLMQPKGIGEYDDFVIKWLYQPILEDSVFHRQFITLDRWIKDKGKKFLCQYGVKQTDNSVSDPTAELGDLGNDHIKAMEYLLKNIKYSMTNFFDWYAKDDENLIVRARLYKEFINALTNQATYIADYIGGIRIRETCDGDSLKAYEAISRQQQQASLKCLLNLAKDLTWLDDPKILQEIEIMKIKSKDVRDQIMKLIFGRFQPLGVFAEKFPEEYSPIRYATDLYAEIWEPTIKNKVLKKEEMELQRLFLGCVIKTSTVSVPSAATVKNKAQLVQSFPLDSEMAAVWQSDLSFGSNAPVEISPVPIAYLYYDMLIKIDKLLKSKLTLSSGATRQHYEYLLCRIAKALNKN
ncbi:MAG: zinc-dependent metalloprotease [Odoribacter sp.]